MTSKKRISKSKTSKAIRHQTEEEFQERLEAKAGEIVSPLVQGVSAEVKDRLKKSILDFWWSLPGREPPERDALRTGFPEDILDFGGSKFLVSRAKKYKADWERIFRNMLRAESGEFTYLDPVKKFIERKRQHVNTLLSIVQYGCVKEGDHFLPLPPGKKPQKIVSFQAKFLLLMIADILGQSGYPKPTQTAFDIVEKLHALPPHRKNEDKRVLLSRWRKEAEEIRTRYKQALELLKPFGA